MHDDDPDIFKAFMDIVTCVDPLIGPMDGTTPLMYDVDVYEKVTELLTSAIPCSTRVTLTEEFSALPGTRHVQSEMIPSF